MDVYSFGVVLLELTTGKEAKYGDEDRSLADWAWGHFQEGTVADAIAGEIREPSYLDEIMEVFTLGIICTGKSPEHRPSMKEVAQCLQRCKPTFGNGWGKPVGAGEYDAALLVGTKFGSRRKSHAEVMDDDHSDDSYV